MIDKEELRTIARARLEDAEVLSRSGRYDGSIHLCGYAIEIALKARICETLGWEGYPSTRSEFQSYQSFRTHDLDVLLSLSGIELHIKANFLSEWGAVAAWDPETRYKAVGIAGEQDANRMINAARALVSEI